jgi:glycosyltransferase involved in cell wall biosynthesis
MLSSPHSWATVSQAILLEMQKAGAQIICRSTNGIVDVPSLLKPTVVPMNQPVQTETSFSYTIPINLARINAKHRIVIANSDNTVLPVGWAQLFNTHAHLILPSSKFAYEILEQNNVKKERMVIVPHGYDPAVFHPNVLPIALSSEVEDKRFKFLMVAAPHWRKGHEQMIKAYIEEFKGDEDVLLIIKSSMNSHEAPAHFHIDLEKIKSSLEKTYKYKWPDIKLINYSVPSLAGLYKYADAVVLPSKTECFSLTMLEAAMCKVPVITTEYGGHLDFLNQENSYLIDYVMKKCPKEGQYHQFVPNSFIAEPSTEHLKQLMRHVKNNYQEAKQKAELCYEQNKHLTWESATNQIIDLINERGWKI